MPSRRELANAIRALSMDAVQKANSGHPGMPMGMADIAEVLWNDFLSHNPANPAWFDRDRFVLSNGHGSMLLYAVLHLTGYDLPMNEIERFRQLGSMTPGHPEFGDAPGVETTTGPLGQGLANAVGMAIAERALAARFNRDGHTVVDHYTYVFTGDGCLMEGISHEACSLAGTLGLEKLIVFYDDNGISIDGEVAGWFTDDTPARFRAYGWNVIAGVDGHDADAVRAAIEKARGNRGAPTLICCKTIIGWGSPNKQGKESCHGAALGADEVALVRETIGWTHPPFHVPDDIYAGWDARARGRALEQAWHERIARYRRDHPALAAELERRIAGELPEDFGEHVERYIEATQSKGESIASRKASQNALNALGPILPELIGGSADLTGSNLTLWSGSEPVSAEHEAGNYLYFGVREFAMSAVVNGLALHGGFIPYGATFLTFSDYARNAVRMAALMGVGGIFVYTHDSIGLGEDGPTHQAVEHVASLRLIPRMSVWRPCDAVESAVAWRHAVERRHGPTALLFSRQSLPHQQRTPEQIAAIARGGYVLRDCKGDPEAIIIATGSEVGIAADAAELLAAKGVEVRVVSMPSTDVFDAQTPAYRESVLPGAVRARVSVEAGVTQIWHKYIGDHGRAVGVDDFGESAPFQDVFAHFGLDAEHVAAAVEASMAHCESRGESGGEAGTGSRAARETRSVAAQE
ncbi:MAG: transketolase [Gammaproteobacteria bacterium]|nr:transketolase [Gammaproteobacteria bacterium]